MLLKGRAVGFLGGGTMGEAIITGLLRTGLLVPPDICVGDINSERLEYLGQKLGVCTAPDNSIIVKDADIVIIAVKPYALTSLLKEIAPVVRPEQTFISIVAGIPTALIESCLDGPVPVVRVMPNMPCLVGEGASAISPGKYANEKNVREAMAIFASVGKAVEVPEPLLDCVTGLSGSGPAYMYMFLEGMIDGAVRLGLQRDVATVLVAQTMLGAAKMVLDTGEHPGRLKDMVTTPGGTTAAGLFALEEGAFRAMLIKAVDAAARRSKELSG